MAYDGYRFSQYDQTGNMNQTTSANENVHPDISINNNDAHPVSHAPPYPTQYTPEQISMPQPQMPPPPSSSMNPELHRNTFVPPRQPAPGNLNDAVNSAFHRADMSYPPPDLIAQITANVVQQLRLSGLDNPQGNTRQRREQQQWMPTTPSSTHAYLEPSSRPAPQPTAPTPSPGIVNESVTYQQPSKQNSFPNNDKSSLGSSPSPPPDRTAFSSTKGVEHSLKEDRPPPLVRHATELTTLEKIWGKLFENGQPTERLGQFLRGIAVHLIKNYPPGNTIVVVPEKMQQFYRDTNIPSDPYPWQDIFDDRTSSISRLYRDAKAEHHLVQESLSERPDIPGLTPRGFQRWESLMILAHPEKEYERLAKAVLEMPISNPDDKKERFPKEIPRRLFPDKPDLKLRAQLDEFITTHCAVDLPMITLEERAKASSVWGPPPAFSDKAPDSPALSFEEPVSFGDQDGHPRSAEVINDDEEVERGSRSRPGSARPIERERKPYIAQPGGGKVYDEPGTTTTAKPDEASSNLPQSGNYPDHHHHTASPGPHHATHGHGHERSSSLHVPRDYNYRHSESDLLGHGFRYADDYRYPSQSPSSVADDIIGDTPSRVSSYRDSSDRGLEDVRIHNLLREREREREKSRHRHEHHPHARSSWAPDEDYYRGVLGGQGGSPVGSGNGYEYKTYTYK